MLILPFLELFNIMPEAMRLNFMGVNSFLLDVIGKGDGPGIFLLHLCQSILQLPEYSRTFWDICVPCGSSGDHF